MPPHRCRTAVVAGTPASSHEPRNAAACLPAIDPAAARAQHASLGRSRRARMDLSGWQPLPEVLWSAPRPPSGAFRAFLLAWTLIMIGAFLACHLDVFELTLARDLIRPAADTLRQPLYWGILMAVWAARVMTVGHLLLAGAVTAYLLFDALWWRARAPVRTRVARCPVTPGPARRELAHGPVPARR